MEVVPELAQRLTEDEALRVAFDKLTPGRQREYNHHFSSAKKSDTRRRRIEKFVPKILAGEGMREGSSRKPLPELQPGEVRLLSGGNPQIPKGDGDGPVQAYLNAVPGWKQVVARDLDAMIAEAVPGVRKAVRWNSPWYGVAGHGWFLSYHCFDTYLKVTFLAGRHLDPEPPISSKDPDARYLHLTDEPIDVAELRSWIEQASAIPGWDGF